MVKGAEITLMTLGLCLSMTTDFVVAPQGVGSHSSVAIADGHKGQKTFTPDFTIMMTLPSNTRSNNGCPLILV